jgi:hypothetical protein
MYRNLNSLAEGTGSQVLGLHTRVNCFITQFQDQHQVDFLSLRLNGHDSVSDTGACRTPFYF